MKPIQNQYRDLLEGKMSKSNFLTNVKRSLSDYVSNVTSFDDAVKILKSKRILSEAKIEKENIYSDDLENTTSNDDAYGKAFDSMDSFDFHKAAIESASGDKVEQREEDEEGDPLYFSLTNDYVNYYIGSNDDIIKYNGKTGERYPIGNLKDYNEEKYEMPGFEGTFDALNKIKINEDWGSSDQATFNKAIHKDIGNPTKMPMPFDPRFEAAVADAVDFWWDEWDEYREDRDELINHAKRLYYRSYFPEDYKMLTQMFSENKEEDDAIIAAYEDEKDAVHTLPGAHIHYLKEDIEIDPKTSMELDRVNPLEYYAGVDYELDITNDYTAENLQKVIKKVLKNLAKDQIYYTNLKAAATGVINSKEIKAAKEQQVKKDNQVDDLNQLKTLVKNQLANTKDTLGKKERATKANPEGVKLMKEGKDTLKEKIKEKIKGYVVKQLKKEAIGFTVGGKEQFVKNTDAPAFEQNLKSTGVEYTKRTVQ